MNENTSVNQPEFEKIDALNREAWAIRVSDSNRAFEWSKEAIRLSEAVQYEKGKAEGLRTFGFCHIRLAKYQEAFALLEQAYSTFVRLGDIRNEAIIHEYFGIIHRSTGNYATSLEELYKALSLISEKHFLEEETLVLYHLSITYKYLGDLDKALEYALKGLPMARAIGAEVSESYHLNGIGGVYFEMGRYEEARDYFQQSLLLRQTTGDQWGVAGCYDNLGNIYFRQGNDQEALHYYLKSLEITVQTGDLKGRGNTLFDTARVYARMHDYDNALDYCRQSLQIRELIGDKKGQAGIFCFLGSLCQEENFSGADLQQSLVYLQKAMTFAQELNARDIMYDIHYHLYKTYKRLGEPAKALDHCEASVILEKELNKEAVQQRILHLQITHEVAQSQKEAEIYRLKNVELANLVKAVSRQKEQLQKALNHLKATQAQLIQSEKLASLGELTAGIAHEIQNPLNFVNNFSELSVDLANELKDEIKKPEKDWELIEDLANDLTQNQQKINHHGKRAAAIVSGMLYHARASTGKKEPTDLNALADEYLRLAWHGLRAKDPNFNAAMHTEFDPAIRKVEVIPQDIGRVLLNLINNAFYAVSQKTKQGVEGYEPAVTVSTQKTDNQVIIKVKDNGTGIPEEVKAKIFQPFFTTKPTGQGTGLGLSLAYDIVVKGHGGALEVETKEGEGTEFIIHLPAKTI